MAHILREEDWTLLFSPTAKTRTDRNTPLLLSTLTEVLAVKAREMPSIQGRIEEEPHCSGRGTATRKRITKWFRVQLRMPFTVKYFEIFSAYMLAAATAPSGTIANSTFTLNLSASPTGTFRIKARRFGVDFFTDTIENATAPKIKLALEECTAIGKNNVAVVAGGTADTYTITLQNALLGSIEADVLALSIGTGSTAGITLTQTSAGTKRTALITEQSEQLPAGFDIVAYDKKGVTNAYRYDYCAVNKITYSGSKSSDREIIVDLLFAKKVRITDVAAVNCTTPTTVNSDWVGFKVTTAVGSTFVPATDFTGTIDAKLITDEDAFPYGQIVDEWIQDNPTHSLSITTRGDNTNDLYEEIEAGEEDAEEGEITGSIKAWIGSPKHQAIVNLPNARLTNGGLKFAGQSRRSRYTIVAEAELADDGTFHNIQINNGQATPYFA